MEGPQDEGLRIEAANWTAWVARGIVPVGVLSEISGKDVK